MHNNFSESRRQADRINAALPVTIRAGSEGGVVMQGNTVDLSDVGLRVRTDLPVLISQNVEVIVNNGDPQPRKYNVIWVREPARENSTFEAGLRMSA